MRRIMKMKTINVLFMAVISYVGLHVNYALAQMEHGETGVNAQVGTVPNDARDPHEYSDGFTLTDGPYAQPGPRQLKLADEHNFWSVLGDRFEYQEANESTVYDFQFWYGNTYDRLVVKAEGDIADGALESSTDLLWGHALSAYFDTQLGVRLDQYDEGESRQWLAIGLQGLAPYWFELDVTAYVSDNGQTALSAAAEYELLFSQKLIFQPRAELNLYGKDDPDYGLGAGLSDIALGVRLRYEFSRQLAPYIGVEWNSAFGKTADYRRATGEGRSDTQIVAGLRFWY